MKKIILITILLTVSTTILSGCMTTWPIVNDLDHYKKWDTYETIKEDKENVEEEILEVWDEMWNEVWDEVWQEWEIIEEKI